MTDLSPSAPITYWAFKATFSIISHIFFREIETSGSHLIPKTGPCIFIVGPHANQFVDGIVFYSNNPRPSYALMAAVSYNRPLIGHVGKILNASNNAYKQKVPVVRPQDIVNVGTGSVTYDVKEPLVLRGSGTLFSQELSPRDFVLFGRNYKAHVARIVSDTELEITHAVTVNDDILPTERYAFKIAPHVDQTPVYEEVHRYLDNNECITIFPEGGSHDRSEMLPLKAGFAVMALGAMAENPNLDLKIVPVGLNYFHPDRFRSRAVISYGQPIEIDREDVEKFKKGGKEKREAVTRLLDQSDEAFKTVTINAPDYDTLKMIQAARRLYRPSSPNQGRPTIKQIVKLNRYFVLGWAKLKGDPRLPTLTRKVKLYNDMLSFFGIRDYQVEKLNISPARAAILLAQRLIKLLFLAGLGTPALLSNLPLIWITHYISKKKQQGEVSPRLFKVISYHMITEALAGSIVKIAAKDVLATWKIIVAAFAAPTLYGIYALLYFVYLNKCRATLSLKEKMVRTGVIWAIQPILHYILMRLGDTGLDIYR
ncbi:hypothetical protein EC973_000884 [Apophysomyces ossiformis]|uniref:Phospholipid/glycerol acyltransferase domain-containing protein n=1 Tax=Apophysomyces ossiformis TaxID=679940 RepID=A0A8H7BUH4_9FUNG|nr:hypothetical protein EC973_000884 [Apophysomyces ossiformis]